MCSRAAEPVARFGRYLLTMLTIVRQKIALSL